MLTIRTLLGNIAKGQSGVPMKAIFDHLDKVYMKIGPRVKLEKAEFEDDDATVVYLKIPSESDPKNYYDVVFWFRSKSKISQSTPFKVYSNSAKFGFSYAYLFHKQGSLLFPEKYPKIMTTQPPNVRNPFAVIGFDKHVYTGLRLLLKQNLTTLVQKSDPGKTATVVDFDKKMKETSVVRARKKSNKKRT